MNKSKRIKRIRNIILLIGIFFTGSFFSACNFSADLDSPPPSSTPIVEISTNTPQATAEPDPTATAEPEPTATAEPEPTAKVESNLIQTENRIEFGAIIYQENCGACHGEEGKSETCVDQAGGSIPCAGRLLNHGDLLCGNPSKRLDEMNWVGSTAGFIASVTEAGRPEHGMPFYGHDFGGPLKDQDIFDVTSYVLSFGSKEFCEEYQAYIDAQAFEWPLVVSELPQGDAVRGYQIANSGQACMACHGDPAVENSHAVGPWAGNFNDLSDRLEGYTTADYFYESMLLPSADIAPDCPVGPCVGPPSSMPPMYGESLSLQDMADLMAYYGIDSSDSNGIEVVYPPGD